MEQTAYLPHNYEEKLKALNAVIWDAAELKFAETKSAKAMTDFLRQEGFTVKEGLAGMKTSYVAEFGSGIPLSASSPNMTPCPVLAKNLTWQKKSHGLGPRADTAAATVFWERPPLELVFCSGII